MDFLRSAYRTKARFFRNDPREIDIRWYRCKPNAQVVERHSFWSRNWLRDKDTITQLGEVAFADRSWDRGNPPLGAAGVSRCGTDDEFSNGLVFPPAALTPYDTQGLPLCCNAGNPPEIEDDVRDINFWRQVEGAGLNVYYTGGSVTGEDLGKIDAAADTVHALPLFAARGGTLAKLGVWLDQVGSLGAQIRAAIYEATSETDLRPLTLVAETGDLAADVGAPNWLVANIGVTLDRTKLYWLCVNARPVLTMPRVGALSSVFCYNLLGFDQSSYTPYFGFKIPLAYGAFPASFPVINQSNLGNGDFAAAAVGYVL
jgi:hypothetical protein